jgi:hypothetical protein
MRTLEITQGRSRGTDEAGVSDERYLRGRGGKMIGEDKQDFAKQLFFDLKLTKSVDKIGFEMA